MIIVHSIRSLHETFETRASEWMLTGAILSLSLVFMINDTMFYGASFEGMRAVVNSQLAWACVLVITGVLRLTVLCINGMYYRTPHFRSLTAFVSSGIWFLFFISFVRNGSLLAAIMPWIFLLDAYNAKRAGREAGTSEYIQRYVSRQETGARITRLANP